jgi:hypothetical protein
MQFNAKHPTHKETTLKFIALIGILIAYFGYMSWKYDASTGASVALLTWTFFVLCTPVADGGFILAFPIRMLFGVRMMLTQIIVWFIAVGINAGMIFYAPEAYEYSFITGLLKHILMQPYPYWSILIISALGTLLSMFFGDEMMDVTAHKDRHKHHAHGFKYKILLVVGLGVLTVVSYYYVLDSLGIQLPE